MNLIALQLVKVIAGICYIMHLLGCGWFALGASAGPGEESWLTNRVPEDSDVWICYTFSIYWALTTLTTVGYGDITPENQHERLYTLMTLLIGALVFGFLRRSLASGTGLPTFTRQIAA